ncbi:MAG: hypothetical protein KH186_04490 [Lachnospiraceae bacterium]|nr:hypothetical protein [Lachnospiraceae bacterium]
MKETRTNIMEERIEEENDVILKGNLAKPISVATVPPTAYGVGDIDDDYE